MKTLPPPVRLVKPAKPDLGKAAAFIFDFLGDPLANITAIEPRNSTFPNKIECRSFTVDQREDAVAFMQSYSDKGFNLYWSINPTDVPVSKKPCMADIKRVRRFHVDCDAREGFDVADEKARYRKLLEDFQPTPSFIIDSGGGLWGLWNLAEPFTDLDRAGEINKAIAKNVGGDHCHNIDRIARLPFTLNVPDEKKRAKGRIPAVAHVIGGMP